MKKSIISLAITTAFLSASAFADTANVNVYGAVEASINSSDTNNGADDVSMDASTNEAFGNGDSPSIGTPQSATGDAVSVAPGGATNTNYIGVQGSEEVGGLTAIYKVEFGFDITNTSTYANTFVDRDQWVGLTGEFGTLTLGTVTTAYKSSILDPFDFTALQAPVHGSVSALMHDDIAGTGGQGRASNTMKYESPKLMDAVTLIGHWTVGSAVDSAGNEDDGSWGMGAHYDNGDNIFAFADYITSDRGGDDDAWKVGGRYKMGDVAVFGQYEGDGGLISDMGGYGVGNTPFVADPGNSTDGSNMFMLGGTYSLGSTDISLVYGQKDDSSTGGVDNMDGYDVITVGAIHNLSDRTRAYGGYSETGGDAANSSDLQFWTVGVGHRF